ncbi:MAG: hypothetical protein NUW08_01950 [Candidatus Uhrbacteria bacterium]|nr:hypothetical protein [Candidatus Uhrbacteria bacterium]
MPFSRRRLLAVLGLSLAIAGAGCAWSKRADIQSAPVDKTAALEAAESIQFIPGDTFEIRQTVLGFGAFIPDLLKSEEGVRTVTIKRFAPTHAAELDWELVATRGTESSKKLRAAYEAELKRNPSTPLPSPTTAMERVTTSGQLLGINLRTPHAAFLPAYWPEGTHDMLGEKTGIWLSDDAFLELSKTNRTILNLGVFDDALNQAVKNVVELKDAIATLRRQASEEEAFKDLTELNAEAERIEWPLTVNGEEKIVSAIRARNWFGEVIVLDSRQNPMILKVTLNPLAAGMDAATGNGESVMNRLFGYEVGNVELKRP